ncbi:ATP-binding protein [Helicobacter sp. faydin-H20]|uniref:sensor histidine kinase n=1 Tax=Helicobacter anatolicus TaxID=2905874 RepID=UPI001E3EFDD6|nr:ATP-binding protein [Helicobacter anatolicus]MCE3036394.1 ATP-binding protein [Helicobacter anatolicus]
MTKRIFWAIFSSALLTFFLGVFLFGYFLEQEIHKKILQNMKEEARFIKDYFPDLQKITNLFTSNRITILQQNGEVIFDNKVHKDHLDNHKNREEIIQLSPNKEKFIARYSHTMHKKTFYYATYLNSDTILRIANYQDSFLQILNNVFYYLFGVILAILFFSYLLSSYLSKLIIKPLNLFDFDKPSIQIYDEFLPFITKITQQENIIKEKNQTLKNKQLKLEVLMQNMQESFLIIDHSFKIVSFNKSAQKLFGPIAPYTNILTISRKKEIKEAITQALKGNQSELTLHFNNAYYQFLISTIYEENKIMGAMIFILDITEKKEVENLRKEFSANVSHELKTPLTSILGYAELIKNNLVDTKDMSNFGDKIYQQSQHLLNLINDIIKISKLDENHFTEEKELFYLKEIVENVLSHLNHKDITITLEGECQIYGVKTLIKDLIFNLCDNAIKYNKPQGKIFITLKQNNKNASFSIQDTGIGINLHNQKRVFERFFREDKSHSSNIPGTGLGLSIVKHIISLHNFNLFLTSKPQEGSTFLITWNLP